MTDRTDAVVLRLVDYKERHRIVTLYGRHTGLCAAIATNARTGSKRFSGHLDMFHSGEAVFGRGKGSLAILNSFNLKRAHETLRTDIVRFAVASFWAELVLATTAEGDASSEQYNVLADALDRLNEAGKSKRLDLIVAFQLRWFELMGVLPILTEEGLMNAHLPVLGEQPLAVARALLAGVGIPELDAQNFQAVGRLTRSLRQRVTGKQMASTQFLAEMLAGP